MGRAAIGGVVAGLLGTAVWVAIGYFLSAEVGYVAWGIGLIVGLGVAAGSDTSGAGPGLIATGIAVGSVLLGKYLVVYFLAQNMMGEMPAIEITDSDVQEMLATEICQEKNLDMPEFSEELDYDQIPLEDQYPAGVWQEAQEKFAELSPAQVETRKAEQQAAIEMLAAAFTSKLSEAAFMDSFGGFDLLWFGLAAFTAFQVGSGGDD